MMKMYYLGHIAQVTVKKIKNGFAVSLKDPGIQQLCKKEITTVRNI